MAKPLFDQTPGESDKQLPSAEITADGSSALPYTSYPAGLPDQFIHEYESGRKILVEIDPDTGKEHFLRNL